MKLDIPYDLWQTLSHTLSENRKSKIENVANHRTLQIRLALEDVHDRHNISACIRSADAFGLIDIDIISNNHHHQKNNIFLNSNHIFKPSSVSSGTSNWLNLNKFDLDQYKNHIIQEDYILYGASSITSSKISHSDIIKVDQLANHAFTKTKKIALIFGNEHTGLSKKLVKYLDYHFTIPMVGFVESLNISVAAAISIHSVTTKLKQLFAESNNIEGYYLDEQQKNLLLNNWCINKNPKWKLIYQHYKNIGKNKKNN